jgi:hypothetical protein
MEGWAVANQVCEGEAWVDLQAPEPIDYAVARARIATALQGGRVQDAEVLRGELRVSEITHPVEMGYMAAAQGARETVAALEAERLRFSLEISEASEPDVEPDAEADDDM